MKRILFNGLFLFAACACKPEPHEEKSEISRLSFLVEGVRRANENELESAIERVSTFECRKFCAHRSQCESAFKSQQEGRRVLARARTMIREPEKEILTAALLADAEKKLKEAHLAALVCIENGVKLRKKWLH